MTAQMQTRVAAHPVFAALSPRQRELLAADAEPVLFAADERVFAEGASADRFWLNETGGYRVGHVGARPRGGRVPLPRRAVRGHTGVRGAC
ncbi:hypothetical protein [Actinocrinis sp.]|uniref:hypothetical protein n=1 Tax=Actinocrinis sp. TaxID=1920516 RepID=UPI002D6BDC2A|nr:hypothetical protein [Actinocrinis sp.]HZP51652.1 hypothetical protein [Actinocrinis sp.]